MHDLTEGKGEFTLILDDPAGNSFLQNIYAPEEDPNMTIEVELIGHILPFKLFGALYIRAAFLTPTFDKYEQNNL